MVAKKMTAITLLGAGLLLLSGCGNGDTIPVSIDLSHISEEIPTIPPPSEGVINILDSMCAQKADQIWEYLEKVYIINQQLIAIKKTLSSQK